RPGRPFRRASPTAAEAAIRRSLALRRLRFAAIGEARIAEAGADRGDAPMLDILHEGHSAQTLDHGVVVDHHHRVVTADLRDGGGELGGEIELAAVPIAARKVLATARRSE